MSDRESLGIEGLFFTSRWRADNGEDSYVIPYASIRPINIVFHGERSFEYGHYGVHLGQEDRLTFLGSPESELTAKFIDCREGSQTFRKRVSVTISPKSNRTLCIAPGIAHTFNGLEGIYTINDYKIFLPEPIDWVEENTQWNLDGDIINIAEDIDDIDIPAFKPNKEKASDLMYRLVAEQQRSGLSEISHMHPETERVEFEDGTSAVVSFSAPLVNSAESQLLTQSFNIEGVEWRKHFVLSTGPDSGIVPLLDPQPMYVVDHGFSEYTHDAYGIHISQEDRLTFLGSKVHVITLDLVDCRERSPTLHTKQTVQFKPDPLCYLIIPNGVAHRFQNLEKVFTVNRPAVKADDWMSYDSSNDVIDWPVGNSEFPTIDVPAKYAPQEFYNKQTVAQQALLSGPETSTPVVVLTSDPVSGDHVRVALSES